MVEQCFLTVLKYPLANQFKVIVTNPEKPIAPGLSLIATVEYYPTRNEDIKDKLIVSVDDNIFPIPLLGFIPCCLLEIDTEVNFGTVPASNKVIFKEVRVSNHGSSPGAFRINLKENLPFTIEPSSGIVEPQTIQLIKVEILTDRPKFFEETLRVNLQERKDAVLKIKGTVILQKLELFDRLGEKLSCLNFGHLYFGTAKIEHVLLYNNGPEFVSWVALLQDDALGTEVGSDVQKETDSAEHDLGQRMRRMEICNLITCFPNQGILLPFQKITLIICFNPKPNEEDIVMGKPPSQQDYAMFLRFEPVGSRNNLIHYEADDSLKTSMKGNQYVELAVVGSVVPVKLSFSRGKVLKFKSCLLGERIDTLCTLKNNSTFLPLTFNFRRISHFSVSPMKAKVQPRGSQDVIFSFAPHQIGTFKMKQVIEFIGDIAEGFLALKTKVFYEMSLTLTGVCKSVTNPVLLKINPGITPEVSNPTGLYVHVPPTEKEQFIGFTRASMAVATQIGIHSHQKDDMEKNVRLAFPNDRSASIRPSDRRKKYRTIFTKVERYTYVDPDFAFTDEEQAKREVHKELYAKYIVSLRERRIKEQEDREFKELNNPVDIGIKPACGLEPPKLFVKELSTVQQKPQITPISKGCLLTTGELASEELKSLTREFSEGLNAIPISPRETIDCTLKLTPKQLHQIIIGPSLIDFGEVCKSSVSEKQMYIINNLPTYIWVQFEIDCKELQQTSPLSHVVPPMSKTRIPVVLEITTLGQFKKSINYTINTKHTGHVIVIATVGTVTLELSTEELILKPIPGLLVETGFRTTVTLYNRKNHPADFSWKPQIRDKGISFSIRPARGTVEAYRDLECEVVWHPGFSSPEVGEFILLVQGGSPLKLNCIAQLGTSNVQFTEERVLFNQIPLGITTQKSAFLQNKGSNHAYFQLLDLNPVPRMNIVPSQGVIPIGGVAKIDITFTPNGVIKFDAKVEVAVRNSKPTELKISGFVISPEVELSMRYFYFPIVPVNSRQQIPFIIQNNSLVLARVEFDFSNYSDFGLTCTDPTEVQRNSQNPDQYLVDLEGKKIVTCALVFSPSEVAAYELTFPIYINGACSTVSSANIPAPVMSALSDKLISSVVSEMSTNGVLSLSINATASRQMVNISPPEIVVDLPSGFCKLGPTEENQNIQILKLTNTSKEELTWRIDFGALTEANQDEIFKFDKESGVLDLEETTDIIVSFNPVFPGKYTGEVTLILVDEPEINLNPIQLRGSVKQPRLTFDPPLVIMMPVPLDSETGEVVTIIPLDYFRESALRVELPEAQFEDEDKLSPLSLQFLSGQVVSVSSGGRSPGLTCQINFKSYRPLSLLGNIVFIDEDDNRFILQVAATSENCLLTLYPYIAFYQSEQQVVLKCGYNGKNNTGEAVLGPCYVPETPSLSNSSSSLGAITSTFFEDSVSDPSYENYADTVKMKNDEADDQGQGRKEAFELLFYPEEDTDEWIFFQKVVAAIQMWFSLFGWPDGNNPISIPKTLRSGVYKFQAHPDAPKLRKMVCDMLSYLSGQPLPGIPSNQFLSSDPTERIPVIELHKHHSTLLMFLKSQGMSLAHVLPEFLLEPEDYKKWTQLQAQNQEMEMTNLKVPNKADQKSVFDIDEVMFESVSKRVWTDVLLQVYKVLVLSRVPPIKSRSKIFELVSSKSIPRIKSDPLASNIYSTSERVILTWLNTHYERTRKEAWKDCQKGVIPPMRWIVNFDKDLLDGLVLAAVLAAYCPFLIPSHILRMYPRPESPEQCLHNCLIVVNAVQTLGLEIDVQATDICDANPITMLLFCVYLFEKLPLYVPEKTIDFQGILHSTIVRQVQVKNPGPKSLVYNARILGRNAEDFSVCAGNTLTIRPRTKLIVKVAFKSRFLYPAEATLLLVTGTTSGPGGATLAFSLKSVINKIVPIGTVKCDSPCYEMKEITLYLNSPFTSDGEFRVIMIESTNRLANPMELKQVSQEKKEETYSPVFGRCSEEDGKPEITNYLSQFFCPVQTLNLTTRTTTALHISFLPFALGLRFCTILLINEKIGEFVFLIEGIGTLPLPSALLPTNSPNLLPVSKTVAGPLNSQPIQYFKCSQNSILQERLKIPFINEAREKALAIAAQKQMSEVEFERRKVTGTLASSSVRAAVAALGLTLIETRSSLTIERKKKKRKTIEYSVTVSMPKHFETPFKLVVPISAASRAQAKQGAEEERPSDTDKRSSIDLPIKFTPGTPGRYFCQIVLNSTQDVRVYMIESVVNASCTQIALDFRISATESLIQDIPISNMTQQDWRLKAFIEGEGFYGPAVIFVDAGETSLYSLMFKPISEGLSLGKLRLLNEVDGTEHIFTLKGKGLSPPAMDHIVLECHVRQTIYKILSVPNHANKLLKLKVVSDLPMVIGDQFLSIPPGVTESYPFSICLWKHGTYKGIISFVEATQEEQTPLDLLSKEANDRPSPMESENGIVSTFKPYKVWFTLEIKCHQGPPERTLTVNCTALDTVGIEIPITNPTKEVLHLDVVLKGVGLKGHRTLTLRPKETMNYIATCIPGSTGVFQGSVLFHSEIFGEFWYALKLISGKVPPTELPEQLCELGKWTRLIITLSNPTEEILELKTFISNDDNFSVEIDPQKDLLLSPHSTLDVPVQFCPSALGRSGHRTTVTFKCPELEEWIFHLTGVGLLPKAMEFTSISTPVGSLSTIFINFKNPTVEDVFVDVILTDEAQLMQFLNAAAIHDPLSKESAFCIPLKETKEIPLKPKEKLDIPVMFSPQSMTLYEALVVIHMVKQNDKDWEYENLEELDGDPKSISRRETGEIHGIRWLYPLHGIPEAITLRPEPVVISCQARCRIEETIEVQLTGSVPGHACTNPSKHKSVDGIQAEVRVTEGFATTEEFLYEIQYESKKIKSQMDSSVALNLVRKDRNPQSGIVTLVFDIIFLPVQPMKQSATLVVQSATGGLWKFPLLFSATEPAVDDTINIVSIGVNKESAIGFRLTSQTRFPEIFNAYFLPGSDLEFAVSPQSGELLPVETSGTMITIGFKPNVYSKKYKATLVIQTPSMQWSYEINGLPPSFFPPTNVLAKTDSRGLMYSSVHQRNFIRENLRLITTAVSSPIKGAPLILRTK
uniref:Cilia- and flagella-associated protein 47 isoform X2 n=1 Tax=Geotrypetes seraphini TaxID=260995 RepID=A0A6P8QZG4_GEOSA|nr:cilia- and flagella-associated protein 47 isoform X2 [Geotrypetes seraphini]